MDELIRPRCGVRLTLLTLVVAFAVTSRLAAQEAPTAPSTSTLPVPVDAAAPTPIASPVHGTRAAADWAAADGEGVPGDVVSLGTATRVTATADRTIHRPRLQVTGTFTVRATFHRTASSSPLAPYGLTLGPSEKGPALAFLIRPDGTVAVHRPRAAFAPPAWMPATALRAEAPGETTADRLEVRVTETTATFLVNGQTVSSVSIEPGEVDGSPGVHIGAGGDVLVTLFTVEGAPSLFRNQSDAR
jgi:hypothetical protein